MKVPCFPFPVINKSIRTVLSIQRLNINLNGDKPANRQGHFITPKVSFTGVTSMLWMLRYLHINAPLASSLVNSSQTLLYITIRVPGCLYKKMCTIVLANMRKFWITQDNVCSTSRSYLLSDVKNRSPINFITCKSPILTYFRLWFSLK